MDRTTPFRFDGKGVNDSAGARLATLAIASHDHASGLPVRIPEFDEIGNVLAAAPTLAVALANLCKHCIGRLGQNVYTIPEFKAALAALAYTLDAYPRAERPDPVDLDLDKIIALFSGE
jgi:hypothetical protein